MNKREAIILVIGIAIGLVIYHMSPVRGVSAGVGAKVGGEP